MFSILVLYFEAPLDKRFSELIYLFVLFCIYFIYLFIFLINFIVFISQKLYNKKLNAYQSKGAAHDYEKSQFDEYGVVF